MKRAFLLLLLTLSPLRGEILKVQIDGVIDPIVSEFITSAVREAEDLDAEFLLISLSTPGGLGISMQEIIQTILNSKVPIVCYVEPQGTHAASAGFFILLSADVAVMAPGTNTGAAHPVFPFGMENKIMLEKVKKDALASLRAIVDVRNRNYELAEKGVIESESYTDQEALEGKLIDLIASSEDQLLEQLEGREITRFSGEKQVLRVQGHRLRLVEMSFRQRILSKIADPNFSLVLGVIGALGLYLEFSHPGPDSTRGSGSDLSSPCFVGILAPSRQPDRRPADRSGIGTVHRRGQDSGVWHSRNGRSCFDDPGHSFSN